METTRQVTSKCSASSCPFDETADYLTNDEIKDAMAKAQRHTDESEWGHWVDVEAVNHSVTTIGGEGR